MATFPHPVEQSDEVRVPDYLGPAGFILQCSNCRRVRRHGTRAWDWVPALVATTATNVSHGICHACVGFYWGGARRARER
jgi:hypothetical protein